MKEINSCERDNQTSHSLKEKSPVYLKVIAKKIVLKLNHFPLCIFYIIL